MPWVPPKMNSSSGPSAASKTPAVMNAVVDALSEFGITHIDMPATPHRIWQAIQAARGD